MKEKIFNALKEALAKTPWNNTSIEITSDTKFGDFASNIALKIAKKMNLNPQDVAHKIIALLPLKEFLIAKAEIAGPGFINFTFIEEVKINLVNEILNLGKDYGKSETLPSRFFNIEYVSANPTGFLHLGHIRAAIYGDSLVRVLRFANQRVEREYYSNNAGNQIHTLAKSLYARYHQHFQIDIPLDQDCYQGEDIIIAASELAIKEGKKYLNQPFDQVEDHFKDFGINFFETDIIKDLKSIGVEFDIFSREKDLFVDDYIYKIIKKLKNTYEKNNALWLKTTLYNDDKDRVVIKNNNDHTYFASDIAYHYLKAHRRNYDQLINILGADHYGYIERLKAIMQEFGYDRDFLDILVVQLVKVLKDNQVVKMSKRSGTSLTLKYLKEFATKDEIRYYMLNKRVNISLDFNVDILKEKSHLNQLYYIQYAHARANQILQKSYEMQIKPLEITSLIDEEVAIINELANFKILIEDIACNYQIHLLTNFLLNLSKKFHSYYNSYKVLSKKENYYRLNLVKAVKIVLKNGLNLLGINAWGKMEND